MTGMIVETGEWTLITFGDIESVQFASENCEGKHIQQVAYSTHHRALTQVCFDCKKIRTNLNPAKETKQER